MGRFRRILYLERRRRGSARAFACAAIAAREHGASLTLAGPPGRRLERLLEVADRLGTEVEIRHLSRTTSPEQAVADYDLAVTVGRTEARGWGRTGGLERTLARQTRCPVWIVHPAQGPEIRVVVAAVDVPDADGGGTSRGALRVASELAEVVGARLHVVHCWSVLGESLLASRTRSGSPRGAERVAKTMARRRRAEVERLVAEEGLDARAEVVLCKDAVVPGLRDAAWRLEADVVVMGTAARTGLAGLLPGNPAERAIGAVAASVLVVPGRAIGAGSDRAGSDRADADGDGAAGGRAPIADDRTRGAA